jgi:predicted ATP-dependent endonuclease of OLD family
MINGDERIYTSPRKYTKIENASSGQQEAHLFPESQMLIIQLISLLCQGNNQILITTHSPYIVSTLNNMLYARKLSRDKFNEDKIEEINSVIRKDFWLNVQNTLIQFVQNGRITNLIDKETELIDLLIQNFDIKFQIRVAFFRNLT